MQKTLYIPIDTTLNYEFECPLLVKKYDTLKFKFAIFSLGILQDLNGQTVDIILHKKDGTTIQKTITDITLNIATIVLDKNASAYVGEVLGEIVITDTGGQATSNIFKFNVSNSLTEDIEIKSKDDIVTIEDMRALIANYKNEISAIGESTQAVEALNNITTYIDTNLSELTSKNATAVKNVTDLKKENDRADTNIPGLTNLNDTAEEKLEEFRLYDTTELNKRVQENTSQLNDMEQQKADDTDSNRTTTDKTVTGSINELNNNKADKTEVNSLATNKADGATVQALSTQVNSLASGSPKGTYATVADLTTAFPTGNNNIYVVSADGCWYYWNSVLTTPAWTSGGTYQSTTIGSKQVAPNSLTDGLFIKRNFEVVGTSNKEESHLVLVYPIKNGLNVGGTISLKYNAQNKISQQAKVVTKIGYCTSDDSSISVFNGISDYLNQTYVPQGSMKELSCSYTIPSDTQYLKIFITFAGMNGLSIDCLIKNITIYNSDGDNLLLLPLVTGLLNLTDGNLFATDIGSKDRLATVSDVTRIDGDIQAQKLYFDNKFLSKWSGKKANVIGDSQTAGANTTKTYHSFLKDILGLSEVRNYGINGSTIGYGSDSMCTRCLNMDDDADLIIILGGTNDFNLARPLGTFYTEENGVRTIREDTGYFRPSINILLKNLKTKYPDKAIIMCTPLHRGTYQSQPTELQSNSNSIWFDEYVESVKDACKIWSIPCLDLYELSGLQPNLPSNASLYFHDGSDGNAVDLLHPNATGHERIANVMAQFLNNVV